MAVAASRSLPPFLGEYIGVIFPGSDAPPSSFLRKPESRGEYSDLETDRLNFPEIARTLTLTLSQGERGFVLYGE